jgi:hypothetical protein
MAVLPMALGSIICNKYDGIYDGVALVLRPRLYDFALLALVFAFLFGRILMGWMVLYLMET